MKTKSALSYFGSDSEVAGELASLLTGCKHVTIPFVGGASILPHLNARAIVANDKHQLAINFYKVMSGHVGDRAALIRRCQTTLSHPSEIEHAQHIVDNHEGSDATDLAWAFWSLCWIARKGKGGTKQQAGLPSVRRTANGGTNASRIRAAANDLEQCASEFERCEWQNIDFRELLPKAADRPGCGVYCDPPWVELGRNYLHPFAEQDHIDLAGELHRFVQTKVVIRYGDDQLVRELYSDSRWSFIEASSRTQSNAVKGEVWIVNHMHERPHR